MWCLWWTQMTNSNMCWGDRAVSEAEASHANAALHASAPSNSAVLSAWLAARSGAPGMPPRPALQQMATELDCLPNSGRLTGPAPYQSHAQWAAACQPLVRCQLPALILLLDA